VISVKVIFICIWDFPLLVCTYVISKTGPVYIVGLYIMYPPGGGCLNMLGRYLCPSDLSFRSFCFLCRRLFYWGLSRRVFLIHWLGWVILFLLISSSYCSCVLCWSGPYWIATLFLTEESMKVIDVLDGNAHNVYLTKVVFGMDLVSYWIDVVGLESAWFCSEL